MKTSVDWDLINQKQAAARQRRLEKLKSPDYQAKQADKQRERMERQRIKAKQRLEDPNYREKQIEKAKAAQQRKIERSIEKQENNFKNGSYYPKQKTLQYKNSSKGLKGRSPTSEERRLMNKIGALPCVCCMLKGVESLDNHQHGPVSLHHVDGRTKQFAHAKVLPLCCHHHDVPAPGNAPCWLFPLHGTGKKLWEKENGTQDDLLALVYSIIGESQPWANFCESP